jgi:hypothetical protein
MSDLILASINGLTPEEYMARQRADEARVRRKNRKEHIIYGLLAVLPALLASTSVQYGLAAVAIGCGWVTLWLTQNQPAGIGDGAPRVRAMPSLLGLVLFLFPITAIATTCLYIYALVTSW